MTSLLRGRQINPLKKILGPSWDLRLLKLIVHVTKTHFEDHVNTVHVLIAWRYAVHTSAWLQTISTCYHLMCIVLMSSIDDHCQYRHCVKEKCRNKKLKREFIYGGLTVSMETRSLLKWPEVSEMTSFSTSRPNSGERRKKRTSLNNIWCRQFMLWVMLTAFVLLFYGSYLLVGSSAEDLNQHTFSCTKTLQEVTGRMLMRGWTIPSKITIPS